MINFSLHKKLFTASGDMPLQLSCTIRPGEFISLYGKSGAGKTSVLRMLAGLMKPENGWIQAGEEWWYNQEKSIHVSPQRRKAGFVFQDYALFPNMNVRENISFAIPPGGAKKVVEELLDLTGLSLLASRKIQTLSGGQQQRVALARALAKKPALLLLDEPLSAIDNEMREQLQDVLLQVHRSYALTTILVSHDIGEIIKLSDRILHLDAGNIQKFASPAEFFTGPVSGAFEINGKVLAVQTTGEIPELYIHVSNKVLKLPVKDPSVQNLKKGDRVEVSFPNSLPVVVHK